MMSKFVIAMTNHSITSQQVKHRLIWMYTLAPNTQQVTCQNFPAFPRHVLGILFSFFLSNVFSSLAGIGWWTKIMMSDSQWIVIHNDFEHFLMRHDNSFGQMFAAIFQKVFDKEFSFDLFLFQNRILFCRK